MFRFIKNNWAEARGTVLLGEILKIRDIYDNSNDDVKAMMFSTIVHNMNQIIKNYGNLDDIQENGKKKLAKLYFKEATKAMPSDVGLGIGLHIVSIFIESHCIPSQKAIDAYWECEPFVFTSIAAITPSDKVKFGFSHLIACPNPPMGPPTLPDSFSHPS